MRPSSASRLISDVIAELKELLSAHPLRERLTGQLMRALATDGRTAEALAAYERLRRNLADELGVADAHPRGARPFAREQYVNKFRILAEGLVSTEEQDRFLDVAQRLTELSADELGGLTVALDLVDVQESAKGLF